MDYLAGELLMQKAGINMVHAPYGRPAGAERPDRGQIDTISRSIRW